LYFWTKRSEARKQKFPEKQKVFHQTILGEWGQLSPPPVTVQQSHSGHFHFYAVAGLMQLAQSQSSSVESALSTDVLDSSELYDPLEGTESDDDNDESTPVSFSASSTNS